MNDTHIERPDNDDENVVCEMLCGAQCLIFPDASTIPADFDFYAFEFGHKASCPNCRDVHAWQERRQATRRILVEA